MIIKDRTITLSLSAVEKHLPLCKCTGQLHSVSICLMICDMIDIESEIATIHLLARTCGRAANSREICLAHQWDPGLGVSDRESSFQRVTPGVSSLEQFGELEPRKGHTPERE